MARPGVTYQEVVDAANHLLQQGKNPTIEQVRLFIGTGSSTTIANHLKEWREKQQSHTLMAAKEQLPQALVTVMKQLWDQLIDQSESKIQSIEIHSQQTITTLQEDLEKYKKNNQRWQHLFNQWQAEKTNLESEKQQLLTTVTTLKNDYAASEQALLITTEQLKEKQERIAELQRLHLQVQQNLEHFREATREQRLLDKQQYDQEKQQLFVEMKNTQEQLASIKNDYIALEREHYLSQQSAMQLENQLTKSTRELQQLQQQWHDMETVKQEALLAKTHWQHVYQQGELALENKDKLVIEAQAHLKLLTQQLEESNQALIKLRDENQLLNHDKWILMQEKAQTEGQLKQMQTILNREMKEVVSFK